MTRIKRILCEIFLIFIFSSWLSHTRSPSTANASSIVRSQDVDNISALDSITDTGTSSVNVICKTIAETISPKSDVYYPGSSQYIADNLHFANSSSQPSTCSVEPGSDEDVSNIINILGQSRTPFGVKSGGHIFNPNFSSTTGVQISLVRFNQIVINPSSSYSHLTKKDAIGTVTIGTGLIWDDVYSALDPLNMTVVGGRESGIGVGGFVLGGGFSYKTNEYGISLANVASFTIVLPNGTIANASRDAYSDIFWAARGSHNNFGIITSLTLYTYPQSQVWGGYITYNLPSPTSPITQSVISATYNYANTITDPKAANVLSWSYTGGIASLSIHVFYNAPTPPRGIFDEFLEIEGTQRDIGSRTYTSLVRAPNDNVTIGYRGLMGVIQVQNFSIEFIKAVVNETFFWGALAQDIDSKSVIDYPMEPFLPTIFTHDENGASWPPLLSQSQSQSQSQSRSKYQTQSYFPQGLEYSWTNSNPSTDADTWFLNAIQSSHTHLASVLENEMQDSALPLYPNYALYTHQRRPEEIWGGNLERLVGVKRVVDPDGVMDLAGGWKVPRSLGLGLGL